MPLPSGSSLLVASRADMAGGCPRRRGNAQPFLHVSPATLYGISYGLRCFDVMRSSRDLRAVGGGGVGLTLPHSDPPRAAATVARDITFLGTKRLHRVSWKLSQIPQIPAPLHHTWIQ